MDSYREANEILSSLGLSFQTNRVKIKYISKSCIKTKLTKKKYGETAIQNIRTRERESPS